MGSRLRQRLWRTVQMFNESYEERQYNDSWTVTSDFIQDTETQLKRLLGVNRLQVKTGTGLENVDLDGYFLEGYPSCALEVIEQFAGFLPVDTRIRFQAGINSSMLAYECPWRLSDGRFFQVDSRFLSEEVVQKSEEFLKDHLFDGSHEEFRESREDLSDGRTKDAIVKAFKSFESSLKKVTGSHSGDVTALLKAFRAEGFMDDIPEDKAKAIAKQTLASIAVLRNELGGHGQGSGKLDVPRSYAALGVHLAAALNLFVIEQYLSSKDVEAQIVTSGDGERDLDEMTIRDDDVPF